MAFASLSSSDSGVGLPSVLGARSVSWSVFTRDGDCSISTPLVVPSRGTDDGMSLRRHLVDVAILSQLRLWHLTALHRNLSRLLYVVVTALRRFCLCCLASLHRRLSRIIHVVVATLYHIFLSRLAALH
jgi:hypothetical protein